MTEHNIPKPTPKSKWDCLDEYQESKLRGRISEIERNPKLKHTKISVRVGKMINGKVWIEFFTINIWNTHGYFGKIPEALGIDDVVEICYRQETKLVDGKYYTNQVATAVNILKRVARTKTGRVIKEKLEPGQKPTRTYSFES